MMQGTADKADPVKDCLPLCKVRTAWAQPGGTCLEWQHLGGWVMGIVEGGKPGLYYKILSQPSPHPQKETDSSRNVGWTVISQISWSVPLFPIPLSHCSRNSTSTSALVLSPGGRDEHEVGQTRKRSPFSFHVKDERWGTEGFMSTCPHSYTQLKNIKKPFDHLESNNWYGSTVMMLVLQASQDI